VSSSDRVGALRSFGAAAAAHRDVIDKGATPPDCIGFNNIGEITFHLTKDPNNPNNVLSRHVLHTLRWRDPKSPQALWALYDVSLDVNDSNYTPIKAADEP
jgi:hypothetical protein